jgi:hypothetical protein
MGESQEEHNHSLVSLAMALLEVAIVSKDSKPQHIPRDLDAVSDKIQETALELCLKKLKEIK